MYYLTWILFFITSVYGHVGLKLASAIKDNGGAPSTVEVLTSAHGLGSLIAWSLSALLWVKILSMDSLYFANAFSSLRYVFVGLAAVFIFNEVIGMREAFGLGLICLGLILVS